MMPICWGGVGRSGSSGISVSTSKPSHLGQAAQRAFDLVADQASDKLQARVRVGVPNRDTSRAVGEHYLNRIGFTSSPRLPSREICR